jgi:hypothetical protein
MFLKKTIVIFVPGSKDMICYSEGKILDLHLDAKNYIKGLDIISNIVTNQ